MSNVFVLKEPPSNMKCFNNHLVFNYQRPHANVFVGTFENINFILKYNWDAQILEPDFFELVLLDQQLNRATFISNGTVWKIGDITQRGPNGPSNLFNIIEPYFENNWISHALLRDFSELIYTLMNKFRSLYIEKGYEKPEIHPQLSDKDLKNLQQVNVDEIVEEVRQGVLRGDPEYLGFGKRSKRSRQRRRRSKRKRSRRS